MSEFQELIKNFGKSRDYVRDFFVYGFKSRQDFTSDKKSARTYDDERRRITSWMGKYVEEETAEAGRTRVKNISLMMDSNLLDENPLFAVWKTKSFTDNDITLHFALFDILRDREEKLSANEIADILSSEYALAVDTQMVRRKLNEYVKEGLIVTEKQGKNVLYGRGLTYSELLGRMDDTKGELGDGLKEAVALMQLELPFGYVGSTVLEAAGEENEAFRVKHSFPVFTLEDEILYQLLSAVREFRNVELEIQNNRNENVQIITGIPLKILVSSRTGRRYAAICQKLKSRNSKDDRFRFVCLRLDQIKKVTDEPTGKDNLKNGKIEQQEIHEAFDRNLDYVWGVSFSGSKTKVKLTLSVDERYEDFILQRLKREGKNGSITRLEKNVFCYEKTVFDPMEMFPWLRTFIGRIIDIRFINLDNDMNETSENRKYRNDFLKDITKLEQMYL